MSRRSMIVVVTLLGGVAACAPQAPAVDVQAELASLRAADARYGETVGGGDLEGMLALYAPDARMVAPEAEPLEGVDAIRTALEAFMADTAAAASFELLDADVSASGDMGYTMNIATVTETGEDGAPFTQVIRDFHVWRKQPDGRWKVVVDIWNAAPPPAPAME